MRAVRCALDEAPESDAIDKPEARQKTRSRARAALIAAQADADVGSPGGCSPSKADAKGKHRFVPLFATQCLNPPD